LSSQLAPDIPGATHAFGVPTHSWPYPQSASRLHVAPARVPHAPHVPSVPVLQYWLWHCDASPHALPFASWPATAWHALGGLFDTTFAHESPASALAQASIVSGVIPVPFAESALEQVVCARIWHAETSPYCSWTRTGEQALTALQTAAPKSVHACCALTLLTVLEDPPQAMTTIERTAALPQLRGFIDGPSLSAAERRRLRAYTWMSS
jgi:hypothetical protein